MGTKEEWNEIEKKYMSREEEIKQEYGTDITKMEETNKKSLKRIDKLTHILTIVGKIFLIIMIILVIFIILIVWSIWKYNKDQVDIDAIKTIESMYNKKFDIISKEIDNNDNEIYKMRTKGQEKIEFTIIKKNRTCNDDYTNNCLKYYFERWNSESKKNFISEESENQGLIKYNIYAKIENLNQIDDVVNKYNEFKEYAKEYYYEDWGIWIEKEEWKRPIATSSGSSDKKIKNTLKRNYVVWNMDKNIKTEEFTQKEIEKYYIPDEMKLSINGMLMTNSENQTPSYFIYDDDNEQYTIMIYEFKNEKDKITVKQLINGRIEEIYYKNKKYTFGNELDIKNNILTYQLSLENVTKIFEATAEYNYESKVINLIIK